MIALPDPPPPLGGFKFDAGRFLLMLRMHASAAAHAHCVWAMIHTAGAQDTLAQLGVEASTALAYIERHGPIGLHFYVASHYDSLAFQIATLTPADPWENSRAN